MDFVEELKWRGMVHDVMPETEAHLSKGIATGYVGFDPTSSSLTVGNLVPVMLLVHFQNAGHWARDRARGPHFENVDFLS